MFAKQAGVGKGDDQPPVRPVVYGEFLEGKVGGNFNFANKAES